METGTSVFMQRILEQVDELEREIGRSRADWERKKGTFHDEGYVYRENLALLDEELRGVRVTRSALAAMDVSAFATLAALKEKVIAELERRYRESVLMRSGIAIILGRGRRMPACL